MQLYYSPILVLVLPCFVPPENLFVTHQLPPHGAKMHRFIQHLFYWNKSLHVYYFPFQQIIKGLHHPSQSKWKFPPIWQDWGSLLQLKWLSWPLLIWLGSYSDYLWKIRVHVNEASELLLSWANPQVLRLDWQRSRPEQLRRTFHTLLSLFSEPWQCSDPLESAAEQNLCSSLPKTLTEDFCCRKRTRQLEREILQEIGRELEIIGSANGHQGEQAVIECFKWEEGKIEGFRGCVLSGTLCHFSSSSSSFILLPLSWAPLWSQRGVPFGEEGETIPEMSCYSCRRACFV